MVAPSSTSPPLLPYRPLLYLDMMSHCSLNQDSPLFVQSKLLYPPSPFLWHRTVALPGSLSLTQGRNMWQNKAEMYQKMEKNSEFAFHCLELPSPPPPLYLYLKDYAIFWQPPGATLLGVSALLVGKSSLWFMVASSTWSLDSSEASDLFASILLN